MPVSPRLLAKRAFVAVLLEIARLYGLRPAVNRDSADKDLDKAFKQVILRAHPDKGGTKDGFQSRIEQPLVHSLLHSLST
jgi:hypothetical protein